MMNMNDGKTLKFLTIAVVLFFQWQHCKAQINLANKINCQDTNVVLPPAWAFGVLYGGYTNQQETVERINQIINHDYPIDAYWIDSWFWDYQNEGRGPAGYLDFVGDTVAYPDMESMWKFMEEEKIKSGIWIWDCVIEEGNEEIFREAYTGVKSRKNPVGYFKDIVLVKNTWHNGGEVDKPGKLETGRAFGNFDFENSGADAYFKRKLKPFFDNGLDFFKLDRTARISFCKSTFEATAQLGLETRGRGFILAHSWNQEEESKRYPAKWTDDTQIDWSHPKGQWPEGGLKENVEFVTMPGEKGYGVPFICCDIGGYSYGLKAIPEVEDDELFIRWAQFGAFLPIMEVFSAKDTPSNSLAWKLSERADSCFREIARFRMQLFPYIYSYALGARLHGENIIESDGKHAYQYLFGKEILVAPVVEKGATTKKINLPGGKWIDFYTGDLYEGNREINIDAPLSRIPLLVKSGAIIPLRDYARAVELGSNKHLTLLVYPGEASEFTLLEDDGTSNDYLAGGVSSTKYECSLANNSIRFVIHKTVGDFKGKAGSRATTVKFLLEEKPKKVFINDKAVRIKLKPLQGSGKSGYCYYNSIEKQLLVEVFSSVDKELTITIQ